MRKNLLNLILAGVMAASAAMTSFAGEWRLDNVGYWWQNDDGSYPVSSWQWLDGNRDSVAECYYFGQDGYMAVNTKIDGYTVNSDGAWTVDGAVQNKAIPKAEDNAEENRKAKEAYRQLLETDYMGNGYFSLLDINQDGIDELFFTEYSCTPALTLIYTYRNGMADQIVNMRNDGYLYDPKNKRIMSGYANHGVESRSVYFHNGTEWTSDHASYWYDRWGDMTESLLTYDKFYAMMQTERSEAAKTIENWDKEYQSYKESWEEMNNFIQTYGTWDDIESGGNEAAEAKNTQANREALLR